MTRHAREALALAIAMGLGEVALAALMISNWSEVSLLVPMFLFLLGPPLFLAVAVWRRRTHPGRTRLLFVVTAACAVGGLSVLGLDLYRYQTDAAFRQERNMRPLIVPLAQWGVVLVVWLLLVVRESREKRAKQNPPGAPPAAAQSPPQSP